MTSPFVLLDYGLGVILEEGGDRRLVNLKTTAPMKPGDDIWSKYFKVSDIPAEYRTPDMVVDLMKEKYLSLETIPYEMRTEEICMYAIGRPWRGRELQFVPDHLITQEMCYVAAHYNNVIDLVPSRFLNINFLIASLRPDGEAFYTIMKMGLLTYRICLEAVKKRGSLLEHVPKRMKSYEMCLEAVRNDGWAYQWTPRPLRDFYLALNAVKNYGHCIKNVKREWRTHDLVKAAISSYPQAIYFAVRKEYWMYLLATSKKGRVMLYAPPMYQTDELLLAAVSDDGMMIKHIRPNRITREICVAAVTNIGNAIEFVPEQFLDGEIRRLASKSGYYVGHDHFTPEVYDDFINDDVKIRFTSMNSIPSAWRHFSTYAKMLYADASKMADIPVDTPGYDVLCKILADNYSTIMYIPYEQLTVDLCLRTLKRDAESIKYIDKRYDIITKLIRLSQIHVLQLLTHTNADGMYMPSEILANVVQYL